MAQHTEYSLIPSLKATLEQLNVDGLKALLELLPTGGKPTRKAELVAAIEEQLNSENLRAIWERLDPTQKLAVAEVLYADPPVFNGQRFRAKYGQDPVFDAKKDRYGYGQFPSLLRLFLYREGRYGGVGLGIPADLARRLLAFVPKPAAPSLPFLDEPPEHFERIDEEYEWQEGDEGITLVTRGGVYRAPKKKPKVTSNLRQIPLTRRDTEREALAEAGIVLRLVDLGKLSVSEKTFLPGSAALREVAAILVGGDFYRPGAKDPDGLDEIGPFKAYAWPLLLQAGGLAELHGKKLALTKTGRAALGKPAAEILRVLWQRWLKNKSFDEFNRVDAIKGQQGKGKRTMTAPAGRRDVIANALRQCAVGAWVKLEDFSRHMQASALDFAVTREPWDLYIGDSNYGNLGHDGYHGWNILQKRYLACLLFEYAATLGLIDLAYVEPWEAIRDFSDMWGTDDLSFLSRYDGLIWFRVNPLGAYCLGLADTYQPSAPVAQAALTVLPSLQIKLARGALSTEEALFLETWAVQEEEGLWRLDQLKTLAAVENGQRVEVLKDFLETRDPQGLPDTVEGLLATSARKGTALKNTGPVLLIECFDDELAELIAGHEQTRSLCQKAGLRHLAVKPEHEQRFRKAVNVLGYGMPKA